MIAVVTVPLNNMHYSLFLHKPKDRFLAVSLLFNVRDRTRTGIYIYITYFCLYAILYCIFENIFYITIHQLRKAKQFIRG